MSKMAHTPGPWEVVNNPPNEDGSTATSIYGSDQYVADVYCGYAGSRNMPNAEAAANARLIAAAPDLLVALEQLVSDYERGIHVEFGGSPWLKEKLEELDYARAAIAKATGASDG